MKKIILIFAAVLLSSMVMYAQEKNSILFITDTQLADSDGNTNLDQAIIDALSEKYEVTTGYTPFDFDAMNDYGLIFIGRTANSSNFTDVEAWADVEVPIIICSAYLLRNSRLKFINSTDVIKVADDGSIYDGIVTMVAAIDESDPAFEGVELESGMLEWYNGFYDYYNIDYDAFPDSNNGTAVAYIGWDEITPATEGKVVMARWEDGVETYDGSGNMPAAYRSYVQFGADDNSTPRLFNYTNYTEASLKVIMNEVKYMMFMSPNYISTGIEDELSNNQLNIYIGTEQSKAITIDMSNYSMKENIQISIVDASGRRVYVKDLDDGNNKEVLPVNLNKGVYIVKAYNSKLQQSQRILIQ